MSLVGPIRTIVKLASRGGPKAIEVKGKGGDRILRHPNNIIGKPVEAADGCQTVFHAIEKSAKDNADKPGIMNRRFIRKDVDDVRGRKIEMFVFGESYEMTYKELWSNVINFGKGLREIGVEPFKSGDDLEKNLASSNPKPNSILIYEDTGAEWVTTILGAFSQSVVAATSYSTLGISSVIEAINEGKINTVVCNWSSLETVINECASKCPTLKNVIYTTHRLPSDKEFVVPKSDKIVVYEHGDVIEVGSASKKTTTPPTQDCMAVVMYTSGSTGKPKGVMLTHKNVAASVSGIRYALLNECKVRPGMRYLSYLPLAHIFEMVNELGLLSLGMTLCFACPRSISSRGAKRLTPDGKLSTDAGYPYPPGAIQEYKPHLMVAVPKIWDLLRTGVEDMINKSSPIIRFLFQTAYSGKVLALSQGRTSPLFDMILFRKTMNVVGGCLERGLNGGGPLHPETQEFVQVVFGIDMGQGYGMTETCCAGTIQTPGSTDYGSIGQPWVSIQSKLLGTELADKERKPYSPNDTMHYDEPCKGRGELLWQGESIMAGYILQKAKTEETLYRDEDGVWLRSGDVGVWRSDGQIQIVDRVKNIVKLKGGEYCAIEHIETVYGTAPFVDKLAGGLMVHADGDMDRPCAFMQVHKRGVFELAKQAGVESDDVEKLCANPKLAAAAVKALGVIAKSEKLGANEVVKAVHLISGTGEMKKAQKTSPWTPENEFLTASNKLNRANVQKVLADELQQLRVACGASKYSSRASKYSSV